MPKQIKKEWGGHWDVFIEGKALCMAKFDMLLCVVQWIDMVMKKWLYKGYCLLIPHRTCGYNCYLFLWATQSQLSSLEMNPFITIGNFIRWQIFKVFDYIHEFRRYLWQFYVFIYITFRGHEMSCIEIYKISRKFMSNS